MREYRKTAAWKAYILTYNQAYRKTLKGRASNKAHFHNRKAGRSGDGNVVTDAVSDALQKTKLALRVLFTQTQTDS